jgi:hypothetical protein
MLQPQQTINSRYQLQQTLGNTAPGRQTWLAVDMQAPNPKKVVIKLLAFHPETQWEDIKLFEREAQILRHLNHPQIPKYRDYFTLEPELGEGLPQLALVQDYILGISLEEMLKQKKKLEPEKVVEIAKQVLNILVYLHELSPPVLHRDIKPSNLIVGEKQEVYLIDFGSVQDHAKNKNATFTIVGTQGYAPPEQLMGKAVAASDLYSLGATLIRLLTGVEPGNLPQRNCRLLWSDRASVSDDFFLWLNQLIEPNLGKRFKTARDAATALESLIKSGRLSRQFQLPNWGLLIRSIIAFLVILVIFNTIESRNREARQIARELTLLKMGREAKVIKYQTQRKSLDEYCHYSGPQYQEVTEIKLKITPSQAEFLLRSQNPYEIVITGDGPVRDNQNLENELGEFGYSSLTKEVMLDSQTRVLSITIKQEYCSIGLFDFEY